MMDKDEFATQFKAEIIRNRDDATDFEKQAIQLKGSWSASAPENMAGPVIVAQEPTPEYFGPEFEATKLLREELDKIKKLINGVAQLIQPVYELSRQQREQPEENPRALNDAIGKLEKMCVELETKAAQVLPLEGEYASRKTIVQSVVSEARVVKDMQDKANYDDLQEALRRHQQKFFGDIKTLLGVLKDQKKAYLAVTQ
jgi:hypothetical protein